MWETFIKIPTENNQIRFSVLFDIVRFKIHPMISSLTNAGIIEWYCFLIHGKKSGVPTTQDGNEAYFHIRMSLKDEKPDFPKSLPDYCVMTRRIERTWVERISITSELMFDTSLFKYEGIEEVWRIIGEQSEWFLKTLNAYKETVEIPPIHIAEFLHYYSNMSQLRVG